MPRNSDTVNIGQMKLDLLLLLRLELAVGLGAVVPGDVDVVDVCFVSFDVAGCEE